MIEKITTHKNKHNTFGLENPNPGQGDQCPPHAETDMTGADGAQKGSALSTVHTPNCSTHTHTRCLQEVRGWHAEQTSAAPSTLHKVTMVGPMEAAVTRPDLDWRVCLGKLGCTQDRQVRKIFHFSYFAERLSALVECQLVP